MISHPPLQQQNGQDMSAMISAVTFEMFFKNLSPYIESDEEFFQLIRNMTGLTTKKPSIQMKTARDGNGEAFVSYFSLLIVC